MRDLERKLRTDLTRAILELEAPPPAQESIRRTELSQLSTDDLRSTLKRARGRRAGTRGKGTAPDVVVSVLLAAEEEWLTMHEIADQARALGHAIETERISTALSNLEFAHGRGHGVHDGYGVEVIRKRRPYLYRLIRREDSGGAEGPRGVYLITIQDKTLYGEPDIAIGVVDAPDEMTACRATYPTIEQLADAGRGRCVPHARLVEPGKLYRLGAVVRIPYDPNAGESK